MEAPIRDSADLTNNPSTSTDLICAHKWPQSPLLCVRELSSFPWSVLPRVLWTSRLHLVGHPGPAQSMISLIFLQLLLFCWLSTLSSLSSHLKIYVGIPSSFSLLCLSFPCVSFTTHTEQFTSDTSGLQMCVWFFPHTKQLSVKPAGCLTIWLSSDTICQETVLDFTD